MEQHHIKKFIFCAMEYKLHASEANIVGASGLHCSQSRMIVTAISNNKKSNIKNPQSAVVLQLFAKQVINCQWCYWPLFQYYYHFFLHRLLLRVPNKLEISIMILELSLSSKLAETFIKEILYSRMWCARNGLIFIFEAVFSGCLFCRTEKC